MFAGTFLGFLVRVTAGTLGTGFLVRITAGTFLAFLERGFFSGDIGFVAIAVDVIFSAARAGVDLVFQHTADQFRFGAVSFVAIGIDIVSAAAGTAVIGPAVIPVNSFKGIRKKITGHKEKCCEKCKHKFFHFLQYLHFFQL